MVHFCVLLRFRFVPFFPLPLGGTAEILHGKGWGSREEKGEKEPQKSVSEIRGSPVATAGAEEQAGSILSSPGLQPSVHHLLGKRRSWDVFQVRTELISSRIRTEPELICLFAALHWADQNGNGTADKDGFATSLFLCSRNQNRLL